MQKKTLNNVFFSLVMSPSKNLSSEEIEALRNRILHRLRSEERLLGFLDGEDEILEMRLDNVAK